MKPTSTTSASPPKIAPARLSGSWRKYVPRALIVLLIAGLVYGLMPKPLAVEIAPVTVGPLVVSVLEEGKTRIRHRYVVSPPVSGHLRRIELRAGAPIEAGKTVLAVLESEPSSFLNPRARAEADARLKGSEAAKMRQENEVARIQASLDLAKKEFVRAGNLKQSGAIATKDWDNAEAQVSMLTRELHAAEFGRQVAEFEIVQAQAAPRATGPAHFEDIGKVGVDVQRHRQMDRMSGVVRHADALEAMAVPQQPRAKHVQGPSREDDLRVLDQIGICQTDGEDRVVFADRGAEE